MAPLQNFMKLKLKLLVKLPNNLVNNVFGYLLQKLLNKCFCKSKYYLVKLLLLFK